MAAEGDIAQRLVRMANVHPDQGKREEAAQAYRELTGQDPPVNEGPMPEGQARMGAPSALANQKRAPIADPAEAVQPSMLGRAAGAVKDFVTGPLNAAAAGFNDRISMGMYPAALDLVGASSPQYRQQLAQENPKADFVGQGVGIAAGAALPGAPAAVLDRAVADASMRAAPQLARTAAGTVGRGAISGAIGSGTENIVRKGDGTAEGMAQAFEEGLAPGAVVGGGFSAAGQLLKGGAAGIRAASPRVRDFVRAKESGTYDAPELQGLAKGGIGVRNAAEGASDAVIARDRQLGDLDQSNFQTGIEPYKSSPADMEKAKDLLFEKAMANLHRDTGEPKDMALANALQEAFEQTGKTKSVGGALDNLEGIRAKAGHDSTVPTPENMANRKVYTAMNEGLGDVLPEGAKQVRSEARTALETERRRRDILANAEGEISRGKRSDGEENTRVGKEKQIATLLERVGDDNKPGRDAAKYLDELAAQDPGGGLARQIELVRAKKAQEALRFTLDPQTPLNLQGVAEAGGLGPIYRQFGRAIGGRALEPAMRVGGGNLSNGGRIAPGLVGPLRDPLDALLGRKKKGKGGI